MRGRQIRQAALLVAVGGIALAAGYWAAIHWRGPALEPGEGVAMAYSFPDLEGRLRSSSEWQGRPVLLNFWATWCPPCREEIPLLMDAHSRYAPRGLQVIGIAIDDREAVAAYSREMGINYTILVGNEQAIPLMGAYGNGTGSLPYSVAVRADGSVASRKIGAYRPAELVRVLTEALEPAGSAASQ